MASASFRWRRLWWLLLLPLAFAIKYAWQSFPIMSGYGAKMMASAIYLQHRAPSSVLAEELSAFPLSLASYKWNETDSSVTGSVWGIAKRRAIYRHTAGATLVNEWDEKSIRAQQFYIPPAPPLPDTCRWPCGNAVLPADSLKAYQKLREVLAKAFEANIGENSQRMRAVVVVHSGQIVAEKYADGFDVNTPQLGWSMTKSLTGALTGILVKQGKLNIKQPAPVPEWRNANDGREKITTEQLLQQTSGLDFEEVYSRASEGTNMLFKKADMAAYTASRPLKDNPGTVWYYTSGNSNVLSRIIRHSAGESDYRQFPYRELFWKIGMRSMVMEPDASGTYVGSSYSWATPRDWARFGLLYLQNGEWNGEQILPVDWVRKTATPAPCDSLQHYGYQWWLNAGGQYPNAPRDMMLCDGYEHQYVFVIPSLQLVIVRMGQTEGDWDADNFLKLIIESLPPK